MTKTAWLKLLAIISVMLIVFGAFIGALNIEISSHSFVYLLFGCWLFGYVAWVRKDKETQYVCFFFTLINFLGVVRWILLP